MDRGGCAPTDDGDDDSGVETRSLVQDLFALCAWTQYVVPTTHNMAAASILLTQGEVGPFFQVLPVQYPYEPSRDIIKGTESTLTRGLLSRGC